MSSYRTLRVFSDGGARGNPGPAGIGVVIKNDEDRNIEEISQYIGETTNNQAEYLALKAGLDAALVHDPVEINCYLDSELVVKQLNGDYRVKNQELLPLFREIIQMVQGKQVSFTHVMRTKNQEADRLVNKALDDHLKKPL